MNLHTPQIFGGCFTWRFFMDDYDDYCDLIDDDEETIETFKDIKEEYNMWLEMYNDCHDDEFFPAKWDKEVYAYAMLDEEQRKKFCN